jgi:hypothetical protein
MLMEKLLCKKMYHSKKAQILNNTQKRASGKGSPVLFFSIPTPALPGSGHKSVISAILFCNKKVAPLLKKKCYRIYLNKCAEPNKSYGKILPLMAKGISLVVRTNLH